MALIADVLLAAGALGAAFYCWILGRRLKKFNSLENGMGGAIAVLSAQVDDLEKTLATARSSAARSAGELTELTSRAEDVRRTLELQMAALHDVVPEARTKPPGSQTIRHAPEDISTPKTDEQQAPAQPMFTRRRTG